MSNGLHRPGRAQVANSNAILREGMKQLELALRKYGAHAEDCKAEASKEGWCPCGWAQVELLLEQRHKPIVAVAQG